ncbi:MAG TPA: DNA topoisomerase [bacterium]|nr:DNA topoisomerase [bacterium]
MKVMIVEKPSMKRKMEAALGNEVKVVTSVGHIESLMDLEFYLQDHFPKDKKPFWSETLKYLPFIPEKFRHMITNKPVYAEIEKALKNATEIILGADPDREGELIHRNILEIAKENGAVKAEKITRIWLHSETAPEIKKAFQARQDHKEFDGYYNAARTREIVDWLVGIQLTILYSVKYGKPGKPVSIGRVQAWLLAEIIKRFIENRDFKPEPFRTFLFLTKEGVVFNMIDEDERVFKTTDLKEADKLFNSLHGKDLLITGVKKKKFVEYAPSLYDLKALQKDAAQRYNIAPDDTLKIAQSLYEKHDLISYPRTDCSVLSESEAKELKNAMNLVYRFDEYKQLVMAVKKQNPELILNSKYIGKLEGHYAIIPVLSYDKSTVPKLSEQERLIFDLIVKRFIATLLKPAKGETTEFTAKIDESLFNSKFKNYTEPGFLEFIKPDRKKEGEGEEDKILSVSYKKNDSVKGDLEMKEDMTKPPKLYKDASLLTLMEKAHLQIKDPGLKKALKEADGIGTAATRASFPPLLIKRGYITKETDGTYIPTDLGMKIYEILPEELVIPDFSANLEQELSGFIKKKPVKSVEEIIRETETFIRKVFKNFKEPPRVFNGKLSDKQIAIIEKHGDQKIKESLKTGDFQACHTWIDNFFKMLDERKKKK